MSQKLQENFFSTPHFEMCLLLLAKIFNVTQIILSCKIKTKESIQLLCLEKKNCQRAGIVFYEQHNVVLQIICVFKYLG